ncbi:MAG: ABC transporter permease [bacterium]|nr:ABC transporter permease [bacterium]
MRLSDALSLSTRMFRTRPMRTLLTILGVGVGIGTVLFLVSLGYGLQNAILSRITTTDSLLALDVNPGTSELIKLDNESLQAISQIPHVEEVSPVITASAQISAAGLTGDGIMYAVNPSFFRLSGIETIHGEYFTQDKDLLISTAAVKLLNLEPETSLGKEIKVTFFVPHLNEEGVEEVTIFEDTEPYKIVGVVLDDTESLVFVPISNANDAGIDSYLETKVKITDADYMIDVRNKIMEMGFFVSALRDTIDQAKKIFKIIQIVLGLFGMVALIVSAIGMFNTMTVMLLERTNEIGIMRSIGVSKGDIKKLFLFESMLMGFLGGLGGVILGYLGGEIANFVMNILAKNFGGQAIDLFERPLWFLLVIIITSAGIGYLTGVFPARRAAKLNPLDALKYK